MTTTEIYVVHANGDVVEYGEASNAWCGVIAIWSHVWRRYLQATYEGSFKALQQEALRDRPGDLVQVPFMDDAELKRLWALGDDGSPLERHELITLRTTFDNVMVKREDIPAVAEAMLMFDAAYLSGKGLPSNVWEQARILRDAFDDVQAYRGVCWNQTSVNGDAWTVWISDGGEDGEGTDRPYNVDSDTGHQWLELDKPDK